MFSKANTLFKVIGHPIFAMLLITSVSSFSTSLHSSPFNLKCKNIGSSFNKKEKLLILEIVNQATKSNYTSYTTQSEFGRISFRSLVERKLHKEGISKDKYEEIIFQVFRILDLQTSVKPESNQARLKKEKMEELDDGLSKIYFDFEPFSKRKFEPIYEDIKTRISPSFYTTYSSQVGAFEAMLKRTVTLDSHLSEINKNTKHKAVPNEKMIIRYATLNPHYTVSHIQGSKSLPPILWKMSLHANKVEFVQILDSAVSTNYKVSYRLFDEEYLVLSDNKSWVQVFHLNTKSNKFEMILEYKDLNKVFEKLGYSTYKKTTSFMYPMIDAERNFYLDYKTKLLEPLIHHKPLK